MVRRMDFGRAIVDAKASIAQIKKHMSWPSYKVRKILGCDGWALRRDLKEAEEWLAWLESNAPKEQLVGVAVKGSGTSEAGDCPALPPFASSTAPPCIWEN